MAVVFVASRKTVMFTSTGLLNIKSTSSEPSLSVTCIVEPDPSVDSNETTAIDHKMNTTRDSSYI